MHELYIAECILNSTRESLPAGVLPAAVEEVRVQVGQLDAVVPDTLQFLFDAIKSESGMPNARLTLTTIPVRCRCRGCADEFELTEPLFLCPACGGADVNVLQGRGIMLTGITARDNEGAECGNPGHP